MKSAIRQIFPDAEMGIGFKLYLVVWTLVVIGLIIFWSSLPGFIKWPLSILEAIAAPDIESFKALFSSGKKQGTDDS